MTDINIEAEGIDQVARQFNAMPDQIKRATNQAVSKTAKKIQSQGIRQLAKKHEVTAKSIRSSSRAFKKVNRKYQSGSVWFGLNPLATSAVGGLKDARDYGGAFARKYFFQGHFLATMQSGHQAIWHRVPGRKMKTKDKQAIEESTVELVHAQSVIEKLKEEHKGTFQQELFRALNYQVNVRG